MRLYVLVLLSLVRVGFADSTIKSTPVKATDLPAGVTVRGEFQSGVKFTDKNGTNYLLFGRSVDHKQNSAMVFVEDWVVPAKGSPRNLLPVRDLVEPCEMGGVTATFHDAARAITDLDGDGITDLRIDGGHELRVVDGLLTGLHTPGESHYELLAAFTEKSALALALGLAERSALRSHEFGDSMLVWRSRGMRR